MQTPAGIGSKLSDTGHMAFAGARMTKTELKQTLNSFRYFFVHPEITNNIL